jgi:acyl-CoA thioesterase
MLKQEVIAALKDGLFTIYSIDKMEEGLEILTGMSAGVPGPEGTYPEDSINNRIMKRLTEISQALEAKKEKEEVPSGVEPRSIRDSKE